MNLSSMVFLLIVSVVSLVVSLSLLFSGSCYFLDWELVSINSASVEMALIVDWMSMMFMSFVCFISSMVLYYSGGYMSGDYNIGRFMYLVLGFVLSMLLLIISPNMISILLGWDGLGLVSYALVIYYQNEKSAGAGMLTALSNRVGDVAILLSISLMLSLGGWNFYFYVGGESLASSYVIFLVVLAAMTKSAQIPFSAWLPAAMAAPTPVSALVHSSTLVTAGVYLLIRFSPSLMSSFASTLLLLLGCLTMFMAGLGANFETDLKKIIALSTLSQLGVMITILSLGWSTLAFFHLLTHALFKALLFMCAGSIIHSVGDYQDIRMMGGLVNFMPISVMCINLANLALCGFPFLAGFYSKDLILEVAFLNPLNEVSFWLLALATGLTVCYSFRLVYYSLSGDYNLSSISSVSDSDVLMTWPMLGLGAGAVMGGAAVSWLVFPAPVMICLTLSVKLLALIVSLIGGFVGYILNLMVENYKLKSLSLYPVVVFSGSMWFMPLLSTIGVSRKVLGGGSIYSQLGDGGWSEYYGGQGIYSTLMKSSGYLQSVQENSIKTYLVILLVWLVGLLLII
nr:NADH dehydrogenase subunit 5 [Macrobrachium rosenbergii]QTX96617.1 NADH dehydrogenase subunit 5 [Macrobrachium rosenbergii]UPO69326.1 NADH dehydrogenase subunit 5 [Macrobrachium rosenbergii]UVU21267.1 NADH dehydrogenase subunit 5 [Macrobrachium rosenbergii]